MTEVWACIKDYPSYEVSNFGNVRSLDRWIKRKGGGYFKKGVLLSKLINAVGYSVVNISNEKHEAKVKTVHRLVAEAFIPKIKNKLIVNHIDGCKTNNHFLNLEWSTYSENISHGYRVTHKAKRGSDNKKTGQTHVYKNSKIIIDLSVGVFYESISEAARSKSIKRATLEGYLNGTRKNKTTLVYA